MEKQLELSKNEFINNLILTQPIVRDCLLQTCAKIRLLSYIEAQNNNISTAKNQPAMLIGVGEKDGIVKAGNGITYASMRPSLNNGETLLRVRMGEAPEPEDLVAQTTFLWSKLGK